MTTKADFTDDEWKLILEGPPGAGLIVSTASRGGTFREAFSIAKAYTEAREQHGESELLDAIVSAKPKVDRAKGSPEEMRERFLQELRDAVALLEQKAAPEEVADYRSFVVALAERVANAKEEGDEPVTDAERSAIDEISAAIGAS
jgi:hypothetical protein